jgi:stage II sporulation protein D
MPTASPSASQTPKPVATPAATPVPTPAIILPTKNFPADSTPENFANHFGWLIYGPNYGDIMMSNSDIEYQLSFSDGRDINRWARANAALMLRDGWMSLYPDASFRPHTQMSRARLIKALHRIASKKSWLPTLQTGTTKSSADGKLVLKSGKTYAVRPDVYLFRQFGDMMYQVKEVALVGGESVGFLTNAAGEITYLEVKPTSGVTTAERDSSFTLWNKTLSASAVQSNLSRYVRGIGTLYDVNIKQYGVSRRAIELEIIGSNGTFALKSGKIRSALRLNEQLFVMNKRYGPNGRVVSYSFTGRGWGHGIGMCQYGAFGLAKQGVKYDKILRHYYTGIDLTKAY